MQYFYSSTAQNVAGLDNVPLSMLTLFQSVTVASWSFVMTRVMDVISSATWLLFITLIYLMTFIVMHMFLAVRLLQAPTRFALCCEGHDALHFSTRLMSPSGLAEPGFESAC